MTQDLIIQSDATKTGGWSTHCQGLTTGGQWGKVGKNLHIKTLELNATKRAIMSFTQLKTAKTIHKQMENIAALMHYLKLRETKSSERNQKAQKFGDG